MSDNILKQCYANYKKASNNYYSDTWKATSNQNIDFFKTKNLKNCLTNSNIRGLAPIDNYPSYDYLNKFTSKALDNLQKKEHFQIYKKNKYQNYFFSSSYTIAYRYFLNVKKKIKNNSNVLIIGDGLGILASMILKTFKCKLFLSDLPETLIYQEYFLRNNLPSIKIQYIANNKDNINFKNRLFLINADQLHRQKINLNLVVNTDSFCEMDKVSVNRYFKFANKNIIPGGSFYYCNPVGISGDAYRNPGEYPLDNSFKLKYIEVFYPSHRDTFCKYLSVLAKKKKNFNFKSEKINLKLKLSVINKFYTDTEKIIDDVRIKKITNSTINLVNKISDSDKILNQNIKKKLYNLFKTKKTKVNSINKNIFYHNFFIKLMKLLKVNKKDEINKIFNQLSNLNKKSLENTCIIKIAALSRFVGDYYFNKILKLVPEDFFEIVFLKYCLYEKKNLYEQRRLLDKMSKFKINYFFDYLKLYYSSVKINHSQISKNALSKIKKQIKNKDNAIYFLKLLFTLGHFSTYYKYSKILGNKFKLSLKDKETILLSTNFLNPATRHNFKNFFSKKSPIKSKNNKSLNSIILRYKIGKLSEEQFLKIFLKNYNDYYSIGYVLKNTLNILTKKNLIILCKKSLKLKSNVQNINFIVEIYFYNFLFKEAFKTTSSIMNIKNYSIFYTLKKYLSHYALLDKYKKNHIKNLSSYDFFKTIHNGRVVILPFLCNGNNAVQVNNN